ncbi:MAG: hypothetical protein IR159_01540 [Brevundimonas sp.]|nr:hypothetical protein [Brevundimonas sp.]
MRVLSLSAALVLLAAGPAFAGDPRGGGHHRPPPPPGPCCGHGGGSHNVNVNVNASARAYAGASATSHLNARLYGGVRGRGYGGGAVYVGGGYGGDYRYIGAPVYYDIDRRALACASAPFGYVVTGFGRDARRPPSCGGRYLRDDYGYDRGGRYGYSERHDSYEERSYESFESYEEYGSFGAYEGYEAYDDHAGRDRRGCDCREPAPYPPPYLPEPPRYEPPRRSTERPYRPRREAPPRQQYRQEPGERG